MSRRIILALVACSVIGLGTARLASPWLRSAAGMLESDAAKPGAVQGEAECELPQEQNAIRFAVIGDSGTGKIEQYQVAQQMEKCREKTGFDFVLMLGDNIYGAKSQQDFEREFELPYKPLLDAGVKFYASIGNHDNANERLYKPFNMGGARYYSFRKGNATFFRAGQQLHGSGPVKLAREATAEPPIHRGRSVTSITPCTRTEGFTGLIRTYAQSSRRYSRSTGWISSYLGTNTFMRGSSQKMVPTILFSAIPANSDITI